MFKQRLISFPLLLFLAFLVVFSADWGPYIFMVLAVPVTLSAILESCIIARKLNLSVHWRLALLAGILIFLKYGIGAKFPGVAAWLPDLALTAVLFFTVTMLQMLFVSEEKRLSAAAGAITTPGVLIFALLPLMCLMRIYFEYGALIFLSLVLATKASDTGGYIFGMLSAKLMKNGNHKIVPSISPKKSWEGTIGGAVFSIAVAALLVHYNCIKLGAIELVIFGFLAFLGSFAGDLTESQLKRVAGIKDSGSWIPGMGGILDVIDSFIYNAPLFYLALQKGVIVCQ